ncbi:hypothetical protein L596_025832 [Steinernema carpocapsae]|uniref:RRM domain-containing protein n=1 Tax=Steinernema carpocapsae TaxID=34508 RepID=A0A4U5M8W7_STECR|nr:hypothetical protein L596_025832 [Steinernema carpocapsae]
MVNVKFQKGDFPPGLTLIASELDPNISEEALRDVFGGLSRIATVQPATVGDGEVIAIATYHTKEDAEEMAEKLNFQEMRDHKVLRVSRFDPKGDEDDIDHLKRLADVIVKNVPATYTDQNLKALFEPFGKIIAAKKSLLHPEHGYVQFEKREEANKAISALDKSVVEGKEINVEKFLSTSDYNKNNLFVKDLPRNITDEELRAIFSEFGQITSCTVTQHRGFGYVAFDTHEEAKAAVEKINGSTPFPHSGPISVSHWLPVAQRKRQYMLAQSANLHVGQLAESVDEELLMEHFSQFGPIRSIKVIRDKATNISKKYGFVNFGNPADAARAMEAMNLFELHGRQIRVSIQRPQEKSLANGMQRMSLGNSGMGPTYYSQPYSGYSYYAPYNQQAVPYGYGYVQAPMQGGQQYVPAGNVYMYQPQAPYVPQTSSSVVGQQNQVQPGQPQPFVSQNPPLMSSYQGQPQQGHQPNASQGYHPKPYHGRQHSQQGQQ